MTRAELIALREQVSTVPCGTCRACCTNDRIILDPARDDLAAYRWHDEGGQAVLDRKFNRECVYLTAAGCSIHDKAPDICKRFDCRILVRMTSPERQRERINQNPSMAAVYAAGMSHGAIE